MFRALSCSSSLREERKLRVFENMVLRRIFGPRRDEVTGEWRRLSRDQNAGLIQSVRIDNSTFERVEVFKYLGINLTNQNSIAKEIKSKLRPGNACYHSVQNLLSSRLLSKTLKIKIV